jgi:AraC-like DNA-binding protein/ABC-type glycerol-3-phosphate transport system substrate-binding protein
MKSPKAKIPKPEGLIACSYEPDFFRSIFPQVTWVKPMKQLSQMDVLIEELKKPTPFCLMPIHLRYLPRLVQENALVRLDKHFSQKELQRYAASSLELARVDHHLYAVPEDIRPYLIFRRRDILKPYNLPIPKNWKHWQEQAAFLKKKGLQPISFQPGGIQPRLGFLGAILGASGLDLNCRMEDLVNFKAELIQAYDWLKNLQQKKLITHFDFFLRGMNDPSVLQEFIEGKIAYFGNWPSSELFRLPQELLKEIEILFFPKREAFIQNWTPLAGYGWVVPSQTKNLPFAIELLKKLQKFDYVKRFELKGGSPFHAWKSLWKHKEILAKHPLYASAHLLDKISHPYLIHISQRKFQLLDESFRQAFSQGLSGNEWFKLLLGRDFTASRRITKNEVVKQTLAYIEQHLSEIKSIHQIATHVQLSPRYFNRIFHKEMKVGCSTYLMQIRMEKAREILTKDPRSLKEVAAKLGFKTPSYFTQVFKRYWKKTPSEMMRKP